MSVRFETLGSGHFHFLNHITPPLALSNRPLPIWALQADRVILQRGSLDVHCARSKPIRLAPYAMIIRRDY